jgi:hypothetical protein
MRYPDWELGIRWFLLTVFSLDLGCEACDSLVFRYKSEVERLSSELSRVGVAYKMFFC